MVVEYIRYKIDHPQHESFETAWSAAAAILDASPECISHEVTQGVENPHSYVVRIEWSSVDAHENGFRKSPAFSRFFDLVKPFFNDIQEMAHYQAPLGADAS